MDKQGAKNALKTFSDNLAKILKEKELTKSDFARLIDCTYTGVGYWLDGKTFPVKCKIYDISDVLDVSLYEMLEDYNNVNVNEEWLEKFEKLFFKLKRTEINQLKMVIEAGVDIIKKEVL